VSTRALLYPALGILFVLSLLGSFAFAGNWSGFRVTLAGLGLLMLVGGIWFFSVRRP
jgi:hypothetical protein